MKGDSDKNTIEALFDEHARELMGYARALLRDEHRAEDALQETFLRLASSPQRLQGVQNMRAYLYKMIRNEAFRLLGKEKRRLEKREAYQGVCLIQQRKDARSKPEEVEELNRALQSLPDEQREVVFLKCVEGFTFAEMAELLDIPQNTASSRYRYGLKKLRELLAEKSNKTEAS